MNGNKKPLVKWLISKAEFQAGRRFEDFDENDFTEPDEKGIVKLKPEKDDPLISDSFVIYEEDRLNDAINDKNQFHEWASYTLEKRFKEKQKRNYECFCGGYLSFYNGILSNEGQPRLLYLKWTKRDKKHGIKESVQIMISNPPPGKSFEESVKHFKVSYSPPANKVRDPEEPRRPPPPPDA